MHHPTTLQIGHAFVSSFSPIVKCAIPLESRDRVALSSVSWSRANVQDIPEFEKNLEHLRKYLPFERRVVSKQRELGPVDLRNHELLFKLCSEILTLLKEEARIKLRLTASSNAARPAMEWGYLEDTVGCFGYFWPEDLNHRA